MKFRAVILVLFLVTGVVSSYASSAPPSTFEGVAPISPTPLGGGDLFDPVFAIMNKDASGYSPGCRGCHIGPGPGIGPWFGDNKNDVLLSLETGVSPDGIAFADPPVERGRAGLLADYLHGGRMPRGGDRWNEKRLAILDEWLITYED
jgi:hypothetical protein